MKKQEIILKNSDNLVVVSNRLIRAEYKQRLTLWEQFLIDRMITMISPDDRDFKNYRLYVRDLAKFMGVQPSGEVYSYILEAARRLLDKKIVIAFRNEEGKNINLETHIVTSLEHLTDEDRKDNLYISLTFHPALQPYLLDLKSNFSQYHLELYQNIKSDTSITLYKIFLSYQRQGNTKITLAVDELKKMMGLEDKYEHYANFKKKIIESGQKNLDAHTDLSFKYQENKTGKKVTSITFFLTTSRKIAPPQYIETFEVQSAQVIEENIIQVPKSSEDKDKFILALSPIVVSKFGVRLNVLINLLEKYSEEAIMKAVRLTEKAIEQGKINNIAGFFVEAVRSDYEDPKEQKQQKETEKREKLKQKVAEQGINAQQQADKKRENYQQEKNNILTLIERNANFAQRVIETVKAGMFGKYYDSSKNIQQNLENKLFEGAFMNIATKIRDEQKID